MEAAYHLVRNMLWASLSLDCSAAANTAAELHMQPGLPLHDFQGGVSGVVDADCPIWDHVVQLFVCCDGDCEGCEATPWLAQHHAGSSWQYCLALHERYSVDLQNLKHALQLYCLIN